MTLAHLDSSQINYTDIHQVQEIVSSSYKKILWIINFHYNSEAAFLTSLKESQVFLSVHFNKLLSSKPVNK